MKPKYKKVIAVELICSLLFVSKTTINSPILINDNGIAIYEAEYNKLKEIGITDREIQTLKEDEYKEYIQMNVLKVYKTSSQTNETLYKKANYLNDDGYSYYDSSDRKIETYVTWYNIENTSTSYFFVKVNLDYKSDPINRNADILGVYFGSENQMQYVMYNGGQRPKFSSKFFYTMDYYHDVQPFYGKPVHEEYYGRQFEEVYDSYSNSGYNYSINRSFSVRYVLPSEYYAKTEANPEYANQKSETMKHYYDFSFTMSAYFEPVYSDAIRSSFSGFHSHQTSGLVVDFPNIEFSVSPPFVTIGSGVSPLTYFIEISSVTFVSAV